MAHRKNNQESKKEKCYRLLKEISELKQYLETQKRLKRINTLKEGYFLTDKERKEIILEACKRLQ